METSLSANRGHDGGQFSGLPQLDEFGDSHVPADKVSAWGDTDRAKDVYRSADFAHTALSELFAAPLPRQVADRSVGKLAGFLAHQAVTRTSSASHCTMHAVPSQAERTSRTPVAGPAGPDVPAGPGGPRSPCGPCEPCPHAPNANATTPRNAASRILRVLNGIRSTRFRDGRTPLWRHLHPTAASSARRSARDRPACGRLPCRKDHR
jgi:hypothetical protein